jgi:hypothetical protein
MLASLVNSRSPPAMLLTSAAMGTNTSFACANVLHLPLVVTPVLSTKQTVALTISARRLCAFAVLSLTW